MEENVKASGSGDEGCIRKGVVSSSADEEATTEVEAISVKSLSISDLEDVNNEVPASSPKAIDNLKSDINKDNAKVHTSPSQTIAENKLTSCETIACKGAVGGTSDKIEGYKCTGDEVPSSSNNFSGKKSSPRHRKYRNHTLDDTSNDSVLENEQERSRSNESKRSAKSEEDAPKKKYRKRKNENESGDEHDTTSSVGSQGEEKQSNEVEGNAEDNERGHGDGDSASSVDDEDLDEFMWGMENTSSENEDLEDIEDDDNDMELPLSSDSSNSGVIFRHVGDTSSSSSSSSNNLLDLEEHEQNAAESQSQPSPSAFAADGKNKTKDNAAEATKRKCTELPKALCKPKPKETWNALKALAQRELGHGRHAGRKQHQSEGHFRGGVYGSLFSAERLELMSKLEGHKGCVNCLNFNYNGTKLASGSDDLTIKIWNYNIGKCITSFQPGHRANVFQAKFLPFVGLDTVIVSCARDNQVRYNELSTSGEVVSSRKLAQHRGPAHKLAIHPENPHVILTCGEDSVVFSIDVREEKPNKILNVREDGRKISLYSIHQNPMSPQEFCVSGKDSYVRIYDVRNLSSASVSVNQNSSSRIEDEAGGEVHRILPMKKFCPHHLINSDNNAHPFAKTNVTAAVYNYNGKEILASYNDEHIYLFDSSHSDGADHIKKYEGHRNNATVKGVNFFGDRSQFVVSGSDCGHIFIWEKNTECIVNFFRGDDTGVVNCLEGNPMVPILATSGLDEDVKIWVPSNENPPKMTDLISTVKKNYKKREHEARASTESDGFLMWALLSHMRSRNRRSRRQNDEDSDETDIDDDEELPEDDDGEEGDLQRNDCVLS